MPPLSIIFCGTPDFAVPSLRALANDSAFRIDHVLTQPDRPVGKKQTMTPPPVKEEALRCGLPVSQPDDVNSAWREIAATLAPPDFLVVVAYGQLLSQEVLDWPRIAPINVHASLLPRWRGASPIQSAILAGDNETGVTLQTMVRALDAGPILAQATTPITPQTTASSLHDTLAALGAELLTTTLKHPLHPTAQSQDGMTVCRKLGRSDGEASPTTMTAEHIDRMVRALTPWPGVTIAMQNNETLKLLDVALSPEPDSSPLPCAQNTTLHLVTVQPASGTPMSGAAWARGRQ